MTHRENALAVLNYKNYERMPIVSFGYWDETLEKWAAEKHITKNLAKEYKKNGDNSPADQAIMKMLGFDFNWNSCIGAKVDLFPKFRHKLIEERPDGSKIMTDSVGLKVLIKPGTVSIPAEIGTSLTDRKTWEKKYLPRMQWTDKRIDYSKLECLATDREIPIGLHCGSLIGTMRNFLGVEEFSYLYADDEELFIEIADTFAELSHKSVEKLLASGTGVKFDYAHYWEDICFKNGPLINPLVYDEIIGPHYKRTTELLNSHGINIVSLDCDGLIDALIPTWINNGVNTMFPIEVGTWGASIAPWREKYGRELRGVGGMNKSVFAHGYAAIDAEIERLRPLIELGGYIPCPDHRIAPDAIFENVQYYCDKLRNLLF